MVACLIFSLVGLRVEAAGPCLGIKASNLVSFYVCETIFLGFKRHHGEVLGGVLISEPCSPCSGGW